MIAATVIATTTKKLRALDPLEEIMWLLEQTQPRAPVLVGELEGATTVQAWQGAIRALERKYAHLSLRINKTPGERPFFAHAADAHVPFQVVPLREPFAIEEEMERAIQASFGDGNCPLMRVTLFHAPARCVVLIASHHAAFDGKTNLFVMLDLLAAVAGEALTPWTPISAAHSTLLGLPEVGPYMQTPASRQPGPETVRASEVRIHVKRLKLSRGETAALVRAARAEGATVVGALVAAFADAGRRYREAWRSAPIRYVVPIDARTALSMTDTPGLFISMHVSGIGPSDRSFWDVARAVSNDLAKSRTREAIAATMLRMRQLTDVEHYPGQFYAMQRNGAMQHELMVTNYGNIPIRSTFGPLKLNALSSGSASGDVDSQKISAITLDGQMMMTHISRAPFPSLLNDAQAALAGACTSL